MTTLTPSRRATPAQRETDLFARLPDVLRKAWRRPPMPSGSAASIPASVTSRAALARLPVLRKSELPAAAQGRAALRRLRPGRSGLVRAAVHLARADFRAGSRQADPWRGARALFAAGFRARRRRAQHLQLSPHPRRLHLRCLGARARLRRDPGRPRQYRAAVRTDRGLSAGRLQRHAGFPQDPARRCRRQRAATSPRSSARWFRARPFRNRCRRRSRRAASTPIRRSAPPISASSRSRPRRARAWSSMRT